MCMYVFFQAEDGIRDLTVTGVQTCALPILPNEFVKACPAPGQAFTNSLGMKFVPLGDIRISIWETRVQDYAAFLQATGRRSEERRVGKECRSRWSPYH